MILLRVICGRHRHDSTGSDSFKEKHSSTPAGSCDFYCSAHFWVFPTAQTQRIRRLLWKQELVHNEICWIKNITRKQDFLAVYLQNQHPTDFLKPHKADFFINGTGRIGEQRHAVVLLQVITVYKRHCTFVQRRRNS